MTAQEHFATVNRGSERWDLEVFKPGCLRYHMPLAAVCGQAELWEASDALAEALAAFTAEPIQ